MIHMVAVFAALWISPAQGRETRAILRWSNGDVLAGTLLESESGRVR